MESRSSSPPPDRVAYELQREAAEKLLSGDPLAYERAGKRLEQLSRVSRGLGLVFRFLLFFWGAWSIERSHGRSSQLAWHWHWDALPLSLTWGLGSSAVVFALLKAERGLFSRLVKLSPLPGPRLRWFGGPLLWGVKSLRQGIALFGVSDLLQILPPERTLPDWTELKALLCGVLIWQMLARTWAWCFSEAQE